MLGGFSANYSREEAAGIATKWARDPKIVTRKNNEFYNYSGTCLFGQQQFTLTAIINLIGLRDSKHLFNHHYPTVRRSGKKSLKAKG